MITECFVILPHRLSERELKIVFLEWPQTNHHLLGIIATDEECQALMFVFRWQVLHPDTAPGH